MNFKGRIYLGLFRIVWGFRLGFFWFENGVFVGRAVFIFRGLERRRWFYVRYVWGVRYR